MFDPIFDLGTIIGKVFQDKNLNGYQDRGEEGVSGAVVALDEGTYVITDGDGRYHFPAVRPGQRLLKINLSSIPSGGTLTTDETRVITVTNGLLSKVNFGVVFERDSESIGKEGVPGVALKPQLSSSPVRILGNTETMTVIVNGRKTVLPGAEVRMGVEDLAENVEIKGNTLDGPIPFNLEIEGRNDVKNWILTIFDPKGEVFHRIQDNGGPPETLDWDGIGREQKMVQPGEVYQYVLRVIYKDGSRGESSRRLFGVNRVEAISLNLAGSAFEAGSAVLSQKAKDILDEAAEVLRQFPNEKVIIEGHADATGSESENVTLSRDRVTTALNYLVDEKKLPAERFVVKWFGSTQPLASNEIEEGREINRRVEIRGQVKNRQQSKILDQFRGQPTVRIDGKKIKVSPDGRFNTEIADPGSEQLKIEIKNKHGRTIETSLQLPALVLTHPAGVREFKMGEEGDGYRI
ncbi:MAG TPA: OmpA family protein, partial [Nitrospiria bacterium]|nr:OmpA family protein [Nitrospiria bacterium]